MKDINELSKKMNEIGLQLTYYGNGDYSVRNPEFANPLLHFNEYNKGVKYDGNVKVKSINIRLYASDQVYNAITIVDNYLYEQ